MTDVIPAAAIAAYRDRRLKRRDLIVYAVALERLSFHQPQAFKVRQMAPIVGMHFGHVAASLRRLTALGYLERGPDDRHHTYILRLNVLAKPHAA